MSQMGDGGTPRYLTPPPQPRYLSPWPGPNGGGGRGYPKVPTPLAKVPTPPGPNRVEGYPKVCIPPAKSGRREERYPKVPTPPPRDRTAYLVLDALRSVCLLCSRRRTFLFYWDLVHILLKISVKPLNGLFQKRLQTDTIWRNFSNSIVPWMWKQKIKICCHLWKRIIRILHHLMFYNHVNTKFLLINFFGVI